MLIGELGLLAVSSDFGKSWRRFEEIYPGSFFTALKTASGRWLVGGLRGHLFASTDQGWQWQQIDLPEQASINNIYQDPQGDIYLATNSGALLRSRDDGQSFSLVSRYKGQELLDLERIGDSLWITGSKGLLEVKLDGAK